jgi:hypothetical protein
MLISHEVPLCLLQDSREFNDYDYALVHLFEEYPNYLSFFKSSLKLNRTVILDNSIFELGRAFEAKRFVYWIEELRPTEYIIPDSLENKEETIFNFEQFIANYKNLPGKKIGVVQGKSFEELVDCYKYMSEKADKIGISFDYSYYLEGSNRDKESRWLEFAKGRTKFIHHLIDNNVINMNKPHHLLGCSVPQEFRNYRGMKWIESLDTSNPVVHAIEKIQYTKEGLSSKKSVKLFTLLNTKREDIDSVILKNNLEIFRGFVNE